MDLDDDTITTALRTGDARRLGDSADSPVAYDGHYWALDDDRWSEVEDPDTVEFLTDAERRLRLAYEAVRRSEE